MANLGQHGEEKEHFERPGEIVQELMFLNPGILVCETGNCFMCKTIPQNSELSASLALPIKGQ